MAATESGLNTTLGSSGASARRELLGPGVTRADERLLPVVPALRPLLPGQGLRRGTTVTVSRSAALALALVAGASAAGSWVAAVGLPDLGIVAAAETGIVLERLALVPAPGPRAWPTVVAALLDAVDVVLVRPPARLPGAQARRLAARARERGAVLVPLGPWSEPADLRLAVGASDWHGLGQGHGHLQARRAEVLVTGRGAATRERRVLLWLPSVDGTIAPAGSSGVAAGSFEVAAGAVGVAAGAVGVPAGSFGVPAGPSEAVDSPRHLPRPSATLPLRGPEQPRVGFPRVPVGALAGEGDAPAGEGRVPGAPLADTG